MVDGNADYSHTLSQQNNSVQLYLEQFFSSNHSFQSITPRDLKYLVCVVLAKRESILDLVRRLPKKNTFRPGRVQHTSGACGARAVVNTSFAATPMPPPSTRTSAPRSTSTTLLCFCTRATLRF